MWVCGFPRLQRHLHPCAHAITLLLACHSYSCSEFVRRRLFGGELGGPAAPKWATAVFLLLLWCAQTEDGLYGNKRGDEKRCDTRGEIENSQIV